MWIKQGPFGGTGVAATRSGVNVRDTKSNPSRVWPDVPRLLLQRKSFLDIRDTNVASSVTAFLAWKSFLIAARGSFPGPEKLKCVQTVQMALVDNPSLWKDAERFVTALRPLQRESANVVADWYAEPSWTKDAIRGCVERVQRDIGTAYDAIKRQDHTERVAELVGKQAYSIRSATLAHGAVHSTGTLFQRIMPAFEMFVARTACTAYAKRAELDLSTAYEECNVGDPKE